jgi:hypothetical protein
LSQYRHSRIDVGWTGYSGDSLKLFSNHDEMKDDAYSIAIRPTHGLNI